MSINVLDAKDSSSFWSTAGSFGKSLKSYFWDSRSVVSGTSSLENAELTRLFRGLLRASVISGGVGAASIAAFGVVGWPVGLLAIPCSLAAYGLSLYNSQVSDFESPYELEKLRSKASSMSLDEVIQTYGWSAIIRLEILSSDKFAQKYRKRLQGKDLNAVIEYYEKTLRQVSQSSSHKFDHHIPRPREFAMLWRGETAHLSCEQIFQTYSFEKLEKYSLVEQSELNCLKKLKCDYELIKTQQDQKISLIEREFQSSIEVHKRNLDTDCAHAANAYNNNAMVRELQGVEMHYTRERQKVQEQQNRSIAEARSRFDSAVVLETGVVYINYERLSPAHKAIYNRLKVDFQHAESSAQRTGNQQIERINTQRNERLGYLHGEEVRARGEKTQAVTAATRRYDEAIREFVQRKNDSLRPIEASLRSTAGDCDGRYRAYLRISGI